MRAMVIGKTAEMYADIFTFYFRNAQLHGLVSPSLLPAPQVRERLPRPPSNDPASASAVAGAEPFVSSSQAPSRRQRTAFVALLLDFETAEHYGVFRALSNVFGGDASTYHGRVIGCRVHMNGFLLKRCGNNVRHPYIRSVLALRDAPPEGGLPALEGRLRAIMQKAREEGEKSQEAGIKWLLNNEAARMAAFPLSVGALTRTEVLAAGESTNAAESMNKLTQTEVKQHGTPTLLGAIQALMAFDASVMGEIMPKGQAFTVSGASDRARLARSLKRRQKNAIPAGSAPPKSKTSSPRRADKPRSATPVTISNAGPRAAESVHSAAPFVAALDAAAAAPAESAAAEVSARAAAEAAVMLGSKTGADEVVSQGDPSVQAAGALYASGSHSPYVAW